MALLSESEVDAALQRLPGWARDGDALRREYDCGDFRGSVAFVNRLEEPAEEMNHHPDLSISWATVEVSLSTHSEGGITAADVALARRIEALAA